MPGLKGVSDYSQEPSRNSIMIINSKEPYNAESPRSALISSYITPLDLFYKRNHGPVPIIDDVKSYRVSVGGLVEEPKEFSIDDIKNLPKHRVMGTLQCAGNRRKQMRKKRSLKGVGCIDWDVAAISNGFWGGAKLADVLKLVGIPNMTVVSPLGGKHVEFVSVDACQEENCEATGGPYRQSISLLQATNPATDVLLAYEMNDEPLNEDHGYPLRVIVPGVIGARSVKWLDLINILAQESQGFFMQKDYKMFSPTVSLEDQNINWSSRRPQMEFPVQCAICSMEDTVTVPPGKITVRGYAISGGGRGIERVDVSFDGGETWEEAFRFQEHGEPYVSDDPSGNKWAWVFFEAKGNGSENTEIIAKACNRKRLR